ncbi:MAG: FAD-dependent oxidoreductase [Cryomorphaceae bacterium]|nr:FAD-dependent oxidoreductase [Cryomorphaceae bacterium]
MRISAKLRIAILLDYLAAISWLDQAARSRECIMTESFEYLVIGNGLIGSAAAKYLAKSGASVAIVGTNEPKEYRTHRAPYSSHHDAGRIASVLAQIPEQARIIEASIKRFDRIEKESLIDFYNPVGCITTTDTTKYGRGLHHIFATVAGLLGTRVNKLTAHEGRELFPLLSFASAKDLLLEHNPAGCINPLKLIAAQSALANRAGAMIYTDTVTALEGDRRCGFSISTKFGKKLQCKKILLSMGSYTNIAGLVKARTAIRVRGETVLLAEVHGGTAESLRSMPCLVDETPGSPLSEFVYLCPPVLYPDGKWYIKVGAKSKNPRILSSEEEIRSWFIYSGSLAMARELKYYLERALPSLPLVSWKAKPCMLTDTPDRLPLIQELSSGIYVATGGNGYGAMASDELGRMAVSLMLNGSTGQVRSNARPGTDVA